MGRTCFGTSLEGNSSLVVINVISSGSFSLTTLPMQLNEHIEEKDKNIFITI